MNLKPPPCTGLKTASERGLADAQIALGVTYAQGLCGAEHSTEAALHYYRMAAEQVRACWYGSVY